MKVGLTYTLRNPPQPQWFTPWPQYYAQAFDSVAELDRAGFSSINFSEHHFDPDGYNPAMVVTLTAAVLRTSRARIGQNIIQLPYHHPVRLAEDLAILDIISGGRISLGVGGGAFESEARAFGIDPKERHSRTTEGIEIIRKCWTEERFSFEGKRFQLQDVRVYPKPIQKPHPAIYVTAMNERSLERAARMGVNVCGQGGGMQAGLGVKDVWQAWERQWHDALARNGRKPGDLQANIFGTCFVTDDPEREWAKHREAILYTSTYRRHDGVQPYLRMQGGAKLEEPEDIPGWQTIFRTPADCLRHLRETFSESAPDELLLNADKPGIPFADIVGYHKAFAEKVMPHLADLPLKKTTSAPAPASA